MLALAYPASILLLSILLCVAGCLFSRQALWKRKGCPPGPKGLPIIGHLHLLGQSPHNSLFQLSKLHGPLMWLRFGSVPVIVASTPQAARLILQTNDQAFAGRPRSVSAVCLLYDCMDIAFCSPNSYWKLMRQLCATDLASNKRVEAFRPVRESEARSLVNSVMKEILQGTYTSEEVHASESAYTANDGNTSEALIGSTAMPTVTMVSLRPKLLRASNNIISRMVFGKKLADIISSRWHDDPSLSLLELLDELVQCIGVFNLGDLIPSIGWMDLQGVRQRSRAAARKLDLVLQEILDTRRQHKRDTSTSCQNHQEDLLDALLSLSTKHAQIAVDNIKAFLLDMFVGGTDTSAYSIEWALAELLANPSKMKMAQEEIDKVVGTERAVQESADLPYLRAVVNETMRLHPILPFLIPHMATQPCKLLEFDVPANAQAYVNVWAIGRDANTWEEPLTFKPERFLNSGVTLGVHSFEMLAFGAGRRGCPGWLLGLLNVQVQLASLLQGFYWVAPPDFDMQDKFSMRTTKAKPLVTLAAPKLPTHLYFDAAAY